MPAKKTSKPRTIKSRLTKKSNVPNWVIGVVLLIVAGTGAFLVYNSFAAGPTVRTVYCQKNSTTSCASANWQGTGGYNEARSAYIRYNARCNMGQKEFRIVGSSKNNWHCLFDGA